MKPLAFVLVLLLGLLPARAAAQEATPPEVHEEWGARRLAPRPSFGALPRYATLVTTRRPPLMASQRVIGARELSVAPRRRSADDLLRLVPGVLLSQHGAEGKGQQIFLRGFDAAHGADVEVLVAGIPINELSNIHGQGYLDLNFMIPEVVRQISVSKGPFQINQGNFANAGTIRFELGVDPADRGTRVGYELGSTIRHRGVVVHAPRGLRKESFLAFEAMHDRGFAPGREARRVSSLDQIRIVDSPAHGTLDLLGAGYYATFGSPGALPAADVVAGKVARDGVSEAELHRVKTQWMASEIYKRDSVMGQAQELGSLWIQGLPLDADERLIERLRPITSAQVQAVAGKYFGDDRLTVATLVPQPGAGKRPVDAAPSESMR